MQASGKLQTAPGCTYDFTSDDLQDLGEIGRGAYGAVNKMVFRLTNTTMAGTTQFFFFLHRTLFCSTFISMVQRLKIKTITM